MSYRTDCSKYGETYVGNPGPVPYCSMTGELEPRCDLCTRPKYTRHDMLKDMPADELAKFLTYILNAPTEYSSYSVSDWLDWLKGESEYKYGKR